MKTSQSQKDFPALPWGPADPLLRGLRLLVEQSLAAWFSDASRLAELSQRLRRQEPQRPAGSAEGLDALVRALELLEARIERLERRLHRLENPAPARGRRKP